MDNPIFQTILTKMFEQTCQLEFCMVSRNTLVNQRDTEKVNLILKHDLGNALKLTQFIEHRKILIVWAKPKQLQKSELTQKSLVNR